MVFEPSDSARIVSPDFLPIISFLSSSVNRKGPLVWRHEKTPSQILENLCYQNKLDKPYYTPNSVTVALCQFTLNFDANKNFDSFESLKEELSLLVLNNWHKIPIIGTHFVPYHVETRSLYHPNKHGVVQVFINSISKRVKNYQFKKIAYFKVIGTKNERTEKKKGLLRKYN